MRTIRCRGSGRGRPVGAEEGEALFDVQHTGVGHAAEAGLGEELRQVGSDVESDIATETFPREGIDGLAGAAVLRHDAPGKGTR